MTNRRTGDQLQVLPGRAGESIENEPQEDGEGEFRFPLGRELSRDFSGPQKGANVARRKNVLGRGLSALLSSSAVPVDLSNIPIAGVGGPAIAETSASPADGALQQEHSAEINRGSASALVSEEPLEGSLIYLSLDRLSPNPGQPRKQFLPEELAELTENIRKTGLLQPIVVRRRNSEPGQLAAYEIVAGERRFRAARNAGLVKIPAILKQLNDREALEIGLIENVQRANLNPLEEASAYQRLIDDFGATQAEVAEKVGKDRASIANALRLLRLEKGVQQLLSNGEISAGHGRALLMCQTAETQKNLAQRIVAEGLSVRAAEAIVSGRGEEQRENTASAGTSVLPATEQAGRPAGLTRESTKPEKPARILALEERLRRVLGTKVTLAVHEGGSGEIRISFFSREELQGLVERLEKE